MTFLAGRIEIADLTADHHGDDVLFRKLADRRGLDAASVAHDGDIVAQAENLIHLVRDVNDRAALFLEPADLIKQTLGLMLCQRRCWLVHDDNLRVVIGGLDNLHHLCVRDWHRVHHGIRRSVDMLDF